uniref:G_PROTEIN_RECEP_F1_2 domain-containing protein n=1 Tax=Caenorhabditis tropicalis TaxID=1561998 RepID=A0A1I7SXQ4_9PELO
MSSSLPSEFWDLPISNNSLTVDDRVTFAVETTQFVLFCITMTIYLIIVWALIEAQRKKIDELNSPFFKLCLSTAGVDICICQAMGVSVLASNRLSVMLFPMSFHRVILYTLPSFYLIFQMWNGYRLWVAIGIQYFTGLLIGISTFFNEVQLFRNSKNGIVPKFLNKTMTNTFFAVGGVFLLANCIYLVSTYCYLFYVLRKRQQKIIAPTPAIIKSRTKERAKMREARLFTMSTIIVGVQLCILTLFIFKGADILAFTTDQFYLVYNAVR